VEKFKFISIFLTKIEPFYRQIAPKIETKIISRGRSRASRNLRQACRLKRPEFRAGSDGNIQRGSDYPQSFPVDFSKHCVLKM
jgi:hypothetical protein